MIIYGTADMKSSEAMILAVMNASFEPVTSRYQCDTLTNWAMKPLGSWSFVGSNVPVRDESTMKWYMKWIIYGTAGFKPRWSPEFFRLLYAIAKIAFITARIIASLDFIYAAPYMIHLIYHFIVDSFLTETLEPTNDQWLHSSVG